MNLTGMLTSSLGSRSDALALGLGALLIVSSELRLARIGRRHPESVPREFHTQLRLTWLRVLARGEGNEILAIQTLRNSMMAASVVSSTAALGLLASVSLLGATVLELRQGAEVEPTIGYRLLTECLLVLLLFLGLVCAMMATRYFGHIGYALTLPAKSSERQAYQATAEDYIVEAGLLYSWSLRCVVYAVPVAVGLLSSLLVPFAAALTLFTLWRFDHPPAHDKRSAS